MCWEIATGVLILCMLAVVRLGEIGAGIYASVGRLVVSV
jgi:hypothetical protein